MLHDSCQGPGRHVYTNTSVRQALIVVEVHTVFSLSLYYLSFSLLSLGSTLLLLVGVVVVVFVRVCVCVCVRAGGKRK